jgi:Uncharacterized conserved protein
MTVAPAALGAGRQLRHRDRADLSPFCARTTTCFATATGEIRVEIEDRVWAGRPVDPETDLRLRAEVDRNAAGTVYLWVQSLDVLSR